jgi:hypothetical protein
MGSSNKMALKRFYSVEKRLHQNPTLKRDYTTFMNEYLHLEHMMLVSPYVPEDNSHANQYFLPHHAVIKESSCTTRVRVVFDGSAKTTTGISLNDMLMVGPTVQQDLFSIITRFRTHQVAFSCDIVKMYRQIWVDPRDTAFQRIFWRDDVRKSVNIYELKTVTYGTASAPYLATKCLQQLAIDEQHNFPLASPAILKDFYVDDLLTGTNTISKSIELRNQLISALSKGGFQKLIKIPINPNFIQLIDSFLSNRTCNVKIQNIKSRPIALQAGVPQGSILSPLLYIVYCRDFPVTDAPRTKTRLFADDTVVWTSQRNPAIAARILQGHLNNIITWTNTWRIKPNPLKSQSILMSYSGARSRHQAPHLLLNNQAIPKLQHIRYLGVTFSKNCTLNQDVKETLKKSRNRANLLYRIRGRIRGCDSKTLYHTYKSYIRPVIEYRAPIYATLYPALLHQISACERRMLRRIFRLPDRFPSDNLHQETNTIPIQSRLKELQSRYVTRTLNSNNALAIQTLSTSFKYPSRDGCLLNRIPKIPKRKLKHPPTALLSPAYSDLPDDLQ